MLSYDNQAKQTFLQNDEDIFPTTRVLLKEIIYFTREAEYVHRASRLLFRLFSHFLRRVSKSGHGS